MFELIAFMLVAFVTWRIIRSNYNQFAHYLNAGMDNEAITHESQLERLLSAAGRYYDERKWVAAEKAYLKVLKLDHKNILAYRRLGMVYSHLQNYEDAAECFEMVAKSQNTASDWQNLATVLYREKGYEEAIVAMEKANGLEASVSRLLALVRLYEATGRNDKIAGALDEARRLDPDSSAVKKQAARFAA